LQICIFRVYYLLTVFFLILGVNWYRLDIEDIACKAVWVWHSKNTQQFKRKR